MFKMNSGVIQLIPKLDFGKTKPANGPDNFRPISVASVLSRVWERVVVDRFIYPALVEPPVDLLIRDQFAFLPSGSTTVIVIVIVIVNSKLLKRHSKAKRRAPAYSRALRQIRGFFQKIVRGRLRSGCQRVRECVKSEGFSIE